MYSLYTAKRAGNYEWSFIRQYFMIFICFHVHLYCQTVWGCWKRGQLWIFLDVVQLCLWDHCRSLALVDAIKRWTYRGANCSSPHVPLLGAVIKLWGKKGGPKLPGRSLRTKDGAGATTVWSRSAGPKKNAGKGEDAPMVDGQLKLLADGIFRQFHRILHMHINRADHTYSTSTVYVVVNSRLW